MFNSHNGKCWLGGVTKKGCSLEKKEKGEGCRYEKVHDMVERVIEIYLQPQCFRGLLGALNRRRLVVQRVLVVMKFHVFFHPSCQ